MVLAVLLLPCPALAMGFCCVPPPTLREETTEAKLILYGYVCNVPNKENASELHVISVLKPKPAVGFPKCIIIPRHIPVDRSKAPPKYVILCDVVGGKIDPYRGIQVESNLLVPYFKGVLALDPKDRTKALEYYFRYLDCTDREVATDAHREFSKATPEEIGRLGKRLSPEKLRRLLENPDAPVQWRALYVYLLGHCGMEKDAACIRRLLDERGRRSDEGIDLMLIGYTMLKPKEGWAFTQAVLADPAREFFVRWSALRAARFFYESRPDVVSRRQVVESVTQLLEQGDIADLAIDQLRRWGRWEVAARVIGLYGKPTHAVPVNRRAILRFALSCPPGVKAPAAFVAELRKKDPELVTDVEELLRIETAK
jgi:hypothetical protein